VLVYSYVPGSNTPDTNTIYTLRGALTLFNVRTGQLVHASENQPWSALTMPSDHQVVLLNSSVGIWERLTAPALARASGGSIRFGIIDHASALSPNGALATYSNGGSTIPFWPTKPGGARPEFQAASAGPQPNAIAISPDGHEAVTADNGALYVARISQGGTRNSAAAIMSPDRGVDLVDLGTGRISRLRISHAIEVAFTGRYLAVLLVNGTVDLWSPGQNGVTRLRSTNVSALGSNAGGVLLAEYDLTDSVLLQQPATGDTIGSLNVASPYFGQPTSLTFSDGGTRLFIAVEGVGQNIPGQLEQWNLSPQHWIRTACQTAGAGLTPGEWKQATGTRAPAQLACDGGQE
jgi:hypothetical protein